MELENWGSGVLENWSNGVHRPTDPMILQLNSGLKKSEPRIKPGLGIEFERYTSVVYRRASRALLRDRTRR